MGDRLDLMEKIGGEDGVQTLAAILEVHGAGIILWNDFWNIIRPLILEQKSFSTILQEHDLFNNNTTTTTNNNSDEELAKQLYYESENNIIMQQQQEYDDAELARKLQAQWNAEEDFSSGETGGLGLGSSIINGNNSSCMDIVVPQHVSTTTENSDINTTTTNDTNLEEEEEEKNKDSFILYHYNGLEGGIL